MRKSFLLLICVLAGAFIIPVGLVAEPRDLGFFDNDSARSVFQGEGPDVYSPQRGRDQSSDDGRDFGKERSKGADEWQMRDNEESAETEADESDEEEEGENGDEN